MSTSQIFFRFLFPGRPLDCKRSEEFFPYGYDFPTSVKEVSCAFTYAWQCSTVLQSQTIQSLVFLEHCFSPSFLWWFPTTKIQPSRVFKSLCKPAQHVFRSLFPPCFCWRSISCKSQGKAPWKSISMLANTIFFSFLLVWGIMMLLQFSETCPPPNA